MVKYFIKIIKIIPKIPPTAAQDCNIHPDVAVTEYFPYLTSNFFKRPEDLKPVGRLTGYN